MKTFVKFLAGILFFNALAGIQAHAIEARHIIDLFYALTQSQPTKEPLNHLKTIKEYKQEIWDILYSHACLINSQTNMQEIYQVKLQNWVEKQFKTFHYYENLPQKERHAMIYSTLCIIRQSLNSILNKELFGGQTPTQILDAVKSDIDIFTFKKDITKALLEVIAGVDMILLSVIGETDTIYNDDYSKK